MEKNITDDTRFVNYDKDVKHFFDTNPGGYDIYYAMNIPTSRFSKVNSLIHRPLSFKYGLHLVKDLGEKESRRLIELMIEAAGIHHMGYDKPDYEAYIKYKTFNKKQKALFDFAKTYAFVRRYTEFLQDYPKYLHPLLLHDQHPNQPFPRIHPGTARLRCTEFLGFSQKRDVLIDIIYYNKHKQCKLALEDKLKVKLLKINTFEEYLRLYGYASLEMYERVPKTMRIDREYNVGWPEYYHFLKSDQYIPYLNEVLYHMFESIGPSI